MTLHRRQPRRREYLMCRPEHFTVQYEINPWMDAGTPVDTEVAVKQWSGLRDTLLAAGHTVHLLEPQAGLPDMVFAANGAFSIDGVAYGAQFRYPQRFAEAAAHRAFYQRKNWRFIEPTETNEGEGDFVYLPDVYGGLVLAGYGFRTEPAAHRQVQEALARPVISLRLRDPRFYHLDTVLASIDDANIAYYPGAFSASSQRVLRQLFPAGIVADEAEALTFGLNLVSDGRNVFLNAEAATLAAKLVQAGFTPVPIDLSELLKGGGSIKCCVAELRR